MSVACDQIKLKTRRTSITACDFEKSVHTPVELINHLKEVGSRYLRNKPTIMAVVTIVGELGVNSPLLVFVFRVLNSTFYRQKNSFHTLKRIIILK